jgi:hypothetical protein
MKKKIIGVILMCALLTTVVFAQQIGLQNGFSSEDDAIIFYKVGSKDMLYVEKSQLKEFIQKTEDVYVYNLDGNEYTLDPVEMYAPEDKTFYIPKSQIEDYKAVGLYEVPVVYMYCWDGRIEVAPKSDIEFWKAAGWYTTFEEAYNVVKEAQYKEYPTATTIWYRLKDAGFSDEVCAGILGNFMAEVGGQTLALNPYASSRSYYGVAQWITPAVRGKDLNGQIDFLLSTMPYEFNTFGRNYYKGFNYDAFCNMTDSQQAALAFAKCYERCTSASHYQRQKNAIVAYNYFHREWK